MTMKILPYRMYSESAKLLAEALDIDRLKKEGSKYHPKAGDVVINWGSHTLTPNIGRAAVQGINFTVLNHSTRVPFATNKHQAFVCFKGAGVSIPDFTTDPEVAKEWDVVVCRTIVDGHEGAGIMMWEKASNTPLPAAPLYTKYVKKKEEFRIHVGRDKFGQYTVIDRTQKVRKREFQGERDTRIRNTANGYVFKRQDIEVPEDVINQARQAVFALGLDFGAVDVIWNKRQQKAYVLEVNTAPGIEGTTLQKYAEFFRGFQ